MKDWIARVEVETHGHEPRGVIVYPARPSAADLATVAPIAEQLVADVAALRGEDREWAVEVLLAELAWAWADTEAYRRECDRRGVLAL